MKVYFAHPMASYGSKREAKALEVLKKYCKERNYTLVNPNHKNHQKAHEIIGFRYFTLLASSCDIIVAIPHKDGRFGNGTYQEIMACVDAGRQIYTVDFPKSGKPTFRWLNFKEISPLSVEETKAYRKRMRG